MVNDVMPTDAERRRAPRRWMVLGLALAALWATGCAPDVCTDDSDCAAGEKCFRHRSGWVVSAVCAPADEVSDTAGPDMTSQDTTGPVLECGEAMCSVAVRQQAPGALCDGAGLCALECATLAGDFDDCDMTLDNGCEADLDTDAAHCGACGRVCESELADTFTSGDCQDGGCVPNACLDGYYDLSGALVRGCPLQIEPETEQWTSVAEFGTRTLGALFPGPARGVVLISETDSVKVDYVAAPDAGLANRTLDLGIELVGLTRVYWPTAMGEWRDDRSRWLVVSSGEQLIVVSVGTNGLLTEVGSVTHDWGIRALAMTEQTRRVAGTEYDIFLLDDRGDLLWYTAVPDAASLPDSPPCEPLGGAHKLCLVASTSLLPSAAQSYHGIAILPGITGFIVAVGIDDELVQAIADPGTWTLVPRTPTDGALVGDLRHFVTWRGPTGAAGGVLVEDTATETLQLMTYTQTSTSVTRESTRSWSTRTADGNNELGIQDVVSIGQGRVALAGDRGLHVISGVADEPERVQVGPLRALSRVVTDDDGEHLWLLERSGSAGSLTYELFRTPLTQH